MSCFTDSQAVTGAAGVQLHVHRRPAAGAVVILAHGITSDGRTWEPLLASLAADWDVLAPDARGHGQSERAPRYQYPQLAEDLSHVADASGSDRVALLGHSMGAAVVALYAALHPQRVSCMILEDPPWRSSERLPSVRHKRATAWRQQLEVDQRGSIGERLRVLQQLRPRWSVAERQACAEAEMRTDPGVLELVAAGTPDWRGVVAGVACPTLLLCGDPARGAIVTPDTAAEARQLLAGLEVETFAAGHTIRADNAADYARAVGGFLRRHVNGHASTDS